MAGIRKATIAQKIFPVICGSSFKNKGVQNLLDAVCDYLPSPLDIPPVKGHDVDDPEELIERKAERCRAVLGAGLQDHDRSVCRSAGFIRVYSGKLNAGESIYNVTKGRRERVGRLVKMHANKREEIQEVWRAISARRSV